MSRNANSLFISFSIIQNVRGIAASAILSKTNSAEFERIDMDNSVSGQKLIIFDTDMGTDDAWALQLLLKAEKANQNVKVLAITVVDGIVSAENTPNGTYRVLYGLGRTDIPIYIGASEALIPGEKPDPSFYGKNGFGDVELWDSNENRTNASAIVQQKNGVQAIRDLIMEHPNQITFVGLGPFTNLALAIKTYPEIKEKLKEVFVMGGNFKGIGNITPYAEFNFYLDPEAAFIVLNSLKCPITVLPYEAGFLNISLDWRFNVLGASDGENMDLFNRADRATYLSESSYETYDPFLVASLLYPEQVIEKKSEQNANVELSGFLTRGQMLLNRQSDRKNIILIEKLNKEASKQVLLFAAREHIFNGEESFSTNVVHL